MTREIINVGTHVGDPNADPLRGAFDKTNINFEKLFDRLALVETYTLPTALPTGVAVTGAPRRLVPTNGSATVASHQVLGSVELGENLALSGSGGSAANLALTRLSADRALLVFRPGSGFPASELENTASLSFNLVAQIVEIAPDGSVAFGPRKAFSNSNVQNILVTGVVRLSDTKVAVLSSSAGASAKAVVVDYDRNANTLVTTLSSSFVRYVFGNNTHVHTTSDGLIAVPDSGGITVTSPTLSGEGVGYTPATMLSPATDALGDDVFVTAGGASVVGSSERRLTLSLYRVVRGFPSLVDRLVTPHAFTSGASVYSLSSGSAFVSWATASNVRAGGLVTVSGDRISLASWSPSGHLALTPWACLPLTPTRFLMLGQAGNATTTPVAASLGAYIWKAIELVGGVLVEKEAFPVVYNAAARTTGLAAMDAVVLDSSRVLVAGIAPVSANGHVVAKCVRFG